MQDLPAAEALLEAIADLLRDRVLDAVEDPALRHEVRVAASLCSILSREVQLDDLIDDRQAHALADLVGTPGSPPELERLLARAIADGRPIDADLIAALRSVVGGKLDVAQPGYAE